MSAPLAGPEGGEPLRRAPSAIQILRADETWPLIGLVLAFPTSLGLLVGFLRSPAAMWAALPGSLASIAAGLAILRWRVLLLRRAFAFGVEVRGRVTHLQEVFSSRLGPHTIAHVVYASPGGERSTQYLLDDPSLRRVRPSVGGEVVLIVHPALSKPLLRDAYLDP